MQVELRQRSFEIELAALHRCRVNVLSLIRSLERYRRAELGLSTIGCGKLKCRRRCNRAE